MAYIENTTMTREGLELLAKAELGAELKYTKVEVGDGQITDSIPLFERTSLVHSIIEIPITVLELKNDLSSELLTTFGVDQNVCVRVGGKFSNQQITEGFMYREIGLFALDPDKGEILYAYGNAGDFAEMIPASTDKGIITEKEACVLAIIGRAENVSAVIDPALSVSISTFKQYVEKNENTFININKTFETKATIGGFTRYDMAPLALPGYVVDGFYFVDGLGIANLQFEIWRGDGDIFNAYAVSGFQMPANVRPSGNFVTNTPITFADHLRAQGGVINGYVGQGYVLANGVATFEIPHLAVATTKRILANMRYYCASAT